MNYKTIITILMLGIALLASGCAEKTQYNNTNSIPTEFNNKITSPDIYNATNNTVVVLNATGHPNMRADVTQINVTHAPMKKAPSPMSSTRTKLSSKAATFNSGVTKTAQMYSYNWAGYAVSGTPGSVTSVKGSWIVPAVNTIGGAANQYSCNWIGIDGYNSGTVEQIGTDSDTDENGNPVYYAWYEFYPAPCYKINIPVKANDRISAEVRYDKKLNYIVLFIDDITAKKSYSILMPANEYSRSSAEWITEAPWSGGVLPLTNFGVTYFGKTYVPKGNQCTATINGKTGSIESFGTNTNAITMVSQTNNPDGTTNALAQPSSLTGKGASFSVAWLRAS